MVEFLPFCLFVVCIVTLAVAFLTLADIIGPTPVPQTPKDRILQAGHDYVRLLGNEWKRTRFLGKLVMLPFWATVGIPLVVGATIGMLIRELPNLIKPILYKGK